MSSPQTPAELRAAFLGVLREDQLADPDVIAAIDELIDKIELVYCGAATLTATEFLLGKSLLFIYEQSCTS